MSDSKIACKVYPEDFGDLSANEIVDIWTTPKYELILKNNDSIWVFTSTNDIPARLIDMIRNNEIEIVR